MATATGNPIVFGTTPAGKRIAVVYTDESEDDVVINPARDRLPGSGRWGLTPMDPSKLSERTRKALAALPPEKRARAEAVVTRIQSPEYQERERRDREILDHEYGETGMVLFLLPNLRIDVSSSRPVT